MLKNQLKRAIGATLTALLLASTSAAHADDAREKVVLQLKWDHEFQFAGYYAAKWQGYYREEGLDVEIRSLVNADGELVAPLDELKASRAQFAVGGGDILVAEGAGSNLSIVCPVFQDSPAALVSLASMTGPNATNLTDMRIASIPHDFTDTELRAMFHVNGLDPRSADIVSLPVHPGTLVSGDADAIMTYAVSAMARAEEMGLELNVMYPSALGTDFYGDTLYTTRDFATNHPQVVEKFRTATIRGWQYALRNREEIAHRIAAELPRQIYPYDDFERYNLQFADAIDSYTLYPAVELCATNPDRLRDNYALLDRIGEISQPYDAAELVFDAASSQTDTSALTWWLTLVGLVLVVALLWAMRLLTARQMLILLAMLAAEQIGEQWHYRDNDAQQAIDTANQLQTVRAKLERSLARSEAVISAMAAFVAASPDLDQREFERVAESALSTNQQLVNLAAAPDLVVRHVYPTAGNESVIGLDYRRNTQQMPAVQRAIDSHGIVMAGPVKLVQGGRGFIARAPVFNTADDGTEQLWGIVSAPIRTLAVYREAGLFESDFPLNLAIRGHDGSGADGAVFFGDKTLFDRPSAVTMPVRFSNGEWQLAAINAQPSEGLNPARLLLIRLATLLIAVMAIFILRATRAQSEARERHRQAMIRSAEFANEVESVAEVGGWRMSASLAFTEMSAEARRLIGIDRESILPSLAEFAARFKTELDVSIEEHFRQAVEAGREFELELERISGNGQSIWIRLIGDPIDAPNGPYNLIGAIQNITERKQAEDLIEYQANYDALTGLPNRSLFRDRLERAILLSRRSGDQLAVLFIDLDNFKSVNDNLGHRAGDALLVEASRRIRNCLRDSDTVGRHSGDEFTATIQQISEEAAVDKIVDALVADMARPFDIEGSTIFCGASVGVSLYPVDGESAESLLVTADQAMYEVKRSGRNGWHFYTREMQSRSERRHQLYNRLALAVQNGDIKPFLQPIVALSSGKTVGCEALARWQTEDGSWISPGDFIPVAEESGLIDKIDYQMLEKSAQAIRAINVELDTDIGLSINVTPRLLLAPSQQLRQWLALVEQVLKDINVTVEITERLLVEESATAANVLHQLTDMGAKIAIDDFGTGYSSLSYLMRFPVNRLKIDRTFIDPLGSGGTEETVVDVILKLAQSLGLEVVAEGIEGDRQLSFLSERQCDFGQGYFFNKALSADDFKAHLRSSQ